MLAMPMAHASTRVEGLHRPHMWPIRRAPEWNTKLMGVRERIVYEKVGRQPMTLYLFHPRGDASAPRPVVIYIHGGALRFGTAMITNANTPHNRLLVSVEQKLIRQGVDFVSVNYRLAPLHPWPVPLMDVKNAVKYLVDHSAALGIDSNRMAVMGDSAGGELSSFVGLTMTDGPNGLPVVRAVVDLFGPTDRRTFAIQWRRKHGLAPNPVYGIYTWKRVRRESAVSYVHPDAPPFLIIQGTRDHIVPPGQSLILKRKLHKDKVAVREILVHHAGHELVPVQGHIHPGLPYLSRQIDHFLTSQLNELSPTPDKVGEIQW